jgi:hypothetical protein
MAACEVCGTKAGMGKKICDRCDSARREQERKERHLQETAAANERAERKRQEQEARQNRYEAFLQSRFDEIEALLTQGITPYLYEIIVISTQSTMNGQRLGEPPELAQLRQYGWAGWEVVGTVPSTYGEAFKNVSYGASSGETWGAGIGGIVVGAYLLMRLPITRGLFEERREYLTGLVANEFPG